MAQDGITISGAPQFSIGGVLSTSFSVLFRNIVPFGAVAIVIGIPFTLVAIWAGGESAGGSAAPRIILALISLLTTMLITSALTFGAFRDLRGQRAGFGEIVARGLNSVFKVIGAALIYSIIVAVALVALIIPGLYLSVIWWVFIPAIVVEGCSVTGSFARSNALTAGRRWQIFFLGLIGVLIQVGFGAVIGFVFGIFIGLGGGGTGNLGWIRAIVQELACCFSATMVAVGYYYLRAEKEGIAITDIAKVFD